MTGVQTCALPIWLEDFNKKSSELYSNILAALGKNGVVSESQNMTAMAQQSTKIANDQVYTE